jgi:hypothetical protein
MGSHGAVGCKGSSEKEGRMKEGVKQQAVNSYLPICAK